MSCRKNAFTLIELLVVISIILLASSIIFIGGNGGEGASLKASQRIASGIVQGARGQAILKNAETRLIIYAETNTNGEIDKMLRFFGIVYRGPDSGNGQTWIAANQGTLLPEGIYFDPATSSSNNWDSNNTMRLDYPLASPQAEGNGQTYYYYGFNSNGTSADLGNPWLVLRAGVLNFVNGTQYVVEFPEEKSALKSALILRRAGTTTLVNDPEDIN